MSLRAANRRNCSLPTSFPPFALFVAALPCIFFSTQARSGCFPINFEVQIASTLEHPPADEATGCPPAPGPVCDEVLRPMASWVSLTGSQIANQEAQLRAYVPDPPAAVPASLCATWNWDRADWKAESSTPGTNVWREEWVRTSFDTLVFADAAARDAYFGANGLSPMKNNRFRVAFCKTAAARTGCTCFSDPSPTLLGLGSFPTQFPNTLGQDLTPAVAREAGDDFLRRETRPENSQGDRLGPGWSFVTTQFVAYIQAAGSYAILKQGAAADFGNPPKTTLGATAFSEAVVALEADENLDGTIDNPSLPGYNFDVRARVRTTDGGLAYIGKVARCHRTTCSEPMIQILSQTGPVTTALKRRLFLNVDCPNVPSPPSPDQTIPCPCRPPLENYNFNDKNATRPTIFQQLFVSDDIDQAAPTISLVVGWGSGALNCPASGDIRECPFWCEVSHTDASANGKLKMYRRSGRTGFDAHEGIYRLYRTGAGSQPVPPPSP